MQLELQHSAGNNYIPAHSYDVLQLVSELELKIRVVSLQNSSGLDANGELERAGQGISNRGQGLIS